MFMGLILTKFDLLKVTEILKYTLRNSFKISARC